jgi:hypothetical protein
MNLHLKFRKNKRYREKRTDHLYIVTSLLLKPLNQYLGFRNRLIPDPQFKRTNNFGFDFRNSLNRVIFQIKSPTHACALPPPPPFAMSLIPLTLSSMLKTSCW